MKKYFCILIVVVFAACQKGVDFSEDTGSGQVSNNITGTWTFISLSGSTQSATEYTQLDSEYKSITYSNYTTTKNTGAITFNNDSTFSAAGISYNLSFKANLYNYVNGVLVDSSASPINYPSDSSSSNGKYVLIGNDSIYFPGGLIFTSNSAPTLVTPNGGKIDITGNTLTITELIAKDTTQESGGLPYQVTDSGRFIITLQKK